MDAHRDTGSDANSRPDGWVLAIDFGTTFSSAALATGDGVDLVDLQGDRRVPSMVLLGEDGKLLVGVLAANQAAGAPDRLERTPKAQVGRSPVLLLGGKPVAVVDAVGAIVTAFVEEARRRRGGAEPTAVTLTHPVRWGEGRRQVLMAAALAAGLDADRAELVEEPVAAASAFRSERVKPGSLVAVYDLGGGTFDAAVLEATETGFVVAGPPGGDDTVGGEAFDERLLAHVGEQVSAVEPEGWTALQSSDERRWRRAHAQLGDQIRLAKETLSVAEQATVYVPGVDRDVLVTRAEFERLISDDVERTLDILDDVVRAAGTTPDELTAVYPVGGSSRIPLVANQLLAHYGDRVVTWDDPQAAVALGAARMARHHLRLLDDRVAKREPAATPTAPVAPPPPPPEDAVTQPLPAEPVAPKPAPAQRAAPPKPPRPPQRSRRRRPVVLAAVALALVGGVAAAVVAAGGGGTEPVAETGAAGTAAEPEPTSEPEPTPDEEITETEADAVVADLERALEHRDVAGFTNLFAPPVVYTDRAGKRRSTKSAVDIEELASRTFAHYGRNVVIGVQSTTFEPGGDDRAVEVAFTIGRSPAGDGDDLHSKISQLDFEIGSFTLELEQVGDEVLISELRDSDYGGDFLGPDLGDP